MQKMKVQIGGFGKTAAKDADFGIIAFESFPHIDYY